MSKKYFFPLVLMAAIMVLSDNALAGKLKLPLGMGGVPDIGTIPCRVFNKMIIAGPLGTKRLLLTWAQGYYHAQMGKTLDEIIQDAETAGQSWDFDSLTGYFVDYCAENPEALTSAAVIGLGEKIKSAN